MLKIPKIEVELVDEVSSTNSVILGRDIPIHGILLVAKKQSHGVGRRGRSWLSPQGNFASTLGLELSQKEHGLLLPWISFWLGIVLFDTVQSFLPPARAEFLTLKWPNDLFWKGKKMAGMLVQVRQQGDVIRVAAGVGVNLSKIPEGNFLYNATSLAEAHGNEAPNLENFTEKFVIEMEKARELNASAIREAWENRCKHLNQEIRFGNAEAPETMSAGIALGLGENGALRVKADNQEILVQSEDVSLRFQGL